MGEETQKGHHPNRNISLHQALKAGHHLTVTDQNTKLQTKDEQNASETLQP